MHRLESAVERASNLVAIVGLLGLIIFAALSVADGLLRTALDTPIDVVRDVGGVWLAMSIACCMPAGAAKRAHVDVRFLGAMLGQRAKIVLDVFASLLVAGLMLIMAYQLFRYAMNSTTSGQATLLYNIPTYPFFFVVAAAFSFALVTQLIVVAIMIYKFVIGMDSNSTADSKETTVL